jgi:hypothetical protein
MRESAIRSVNKKTKKNSTPIFFVVIFFQADMEPSEPFLIFVREKPDNPYTWMSNIHLDPTMKLHPIRIRKYSFRSRYEYKGESRAGDST